MALPVIQLPDVSFSNNLTTKGSAYLRQMRRTRQAMPYDIPTSYTRIDVRTVHASWNGPAPNSKHNALTGEHAYMPGPIPANLLGYSSAVVWAKNAARSKLDTELGEKIQLAVTWHERQQAFDAVGSKLTAVRRVALDCRSELKRVRRKARGKNVAKTFANLFIEARFQWIPLVQDVFNLTALLENIPASGSVKVHASSPFGGNWAGNLGICTNGQSGGFGTMKGRVVAKAGCDFKVTNPNLYLASRLGLTNPIAVAWELVPWSFAVDWFVNVGEWINQFDSHLGVEIQKPWYSTRAKVYGSSFSWWHESCSPKKRKYVDSYTKEGLYVYRELGLPEIKLGFRPLKRWSKVRAATAIALLVQQLRPSSSRS